MQVGDTVTMEIGGQPVAIQITGLLSTRPFNNTGDSGIIIVSEETFRQITGEENYTIIDMQLSSDATDEDVNAIHRTYGAGFDFVDIRMDILSCSTSSGLMPSVLLISSSTRGPQKPP